MKECLIILTSLLFISNLSAQEGYPKPTVKNLLFYIQHNRGKNTFIYQPNFSKPGILNDNSPILVKRQLFDQSGEIKSLTSVQRKFAYGVHTKKIDHNYYEVALVAYPNQKLYLRLDKHHQAFVETTLHGKYLKVERLFIHQREGTSGLNTKVDHITFYGKDKQGDAAQMVLNIKD